MTTNCHQSLMGMVNFLDLSEKTRRSERDRKVTTFIPRDVRRSVWDLITKHGRSVREARFRTGLTEKQITDVLAQRLSEEIEQAVLADRARRGPQPPAMIARRAA